MTNEFPGDAPVDGSVTFFRDGQAMGPAVDVEGGSAQILLPVLPAGSYEIEARYSGNAAGTLNPSSSTVTYVVRGSALPTTGADLWPLLVPAGLLALLGVGLVVFRRVRNA